MTTPTVTTPEPTHTTWRDNLRQALHIVDSSLALVADVLDNTSRLIHTLRDDAHDVALASEELARSAALASRQVQQALRATPRFTRILSEGLRVLALYQIHKRKALFLSPEGARAELDALHARAALRVHDLCVELGGGVLKLGQFMSARMDLLPEPWIAALSHLQDRVPPEDLDDLHALLQRELGQHPDDLFASLDPTPIAAASLAQVHAATLHDGTRLAVKIQRPGIGERIEIDIAALRVLAHVTAELLPDAFDLETITRELTRSLRDELDFLAEAQATLDFQTRFQDHPHVVIPTPIPELSSARVLTLHHIDGARLTDFLDATEPAARDALLRHLIDAFCAQILGHGTFHADPHPGNFLVVDPDTPNPRLAILDFGATCELEPHVRDAYGELTQVILFGDAEQMATLLHRVGFQTRDDDPAVLIEMAQMILEAFRSETNLADIDPRAQIERAIAIAQENPVVAIPQSFVQLGRVLATLGGLLFHYKPRVNLMLTLAPWL